MKEIKYQENYQENFEKEEFDVTVALIYSTLTK